MEFTISVDFKSWPSRFSIWLADLVSGAGLYEVVFGDGTSIRVHASGKGSARQHAFAVNAGQLIKSIQKFVK